MMAKSTDLASHENMTQIIFLSVQPIRGLGTMLLIVGVGKGWFILSAKFLIKPWF